MVGSPPWPLSLPTCHHFKSDWTIHCSDVHIKWQFILRNLQQLYGFVMFCLLVPEAKALHSCLWHRERASNTSELVPLPRCHVARQTSATKSGRFRRPLPLQVLPHRDVQSAPKVGCPWVSGAASILEFAKASRRSVLPSCGSCRYKRSASGTAKDIDWDGRLARSLACQGQVPIPWCVLTSAGTSCLDQLLWVRSKQEKLATKSLHQGCKFNTHARQQSKVKKNHSEDSTVPRTDPKT